MGYLLYAKSGVFGLSFIMIAAVSDRDIAGGLLLWTVADIK